MKSLMWLVSCILTDVGILCCTDTARDISYVSRRVEHEGSSFLTISLSDFGRDFERSLDLGQIFPGAFLGFHTKRRSALPVFLQGLLERVFNVDGRLLDEPCIDSIRSIRQVCLMWKKLQLPCSEERSRASFAQFIKCDSEVPTDLSEFDPRILKRFREVSSVIWGSSLFGVDLLVANGEVVPRHGPGATAERISGNGKYAFAEWHTRLEEAFPFTGFGLSSLSQLEEDPIENVVFREPEDERPVRVIQVPKTLKAPRIIAIEPVCMQYTQQALLEVIVPAIENHELTAGHVNFTNQLVNRDLALRGSMSGEFATLDLSEASDRVPLVLVECMLESPNLENLKAAILACRSTRADVPEHGIHSLRKFASMGSALCFPIESMLFYTLALCGVMEELNLPSTWLGCRSASKHVWVYGDDIIVSTDKVHAVARWLEAVKLKINDRKSFWTGKFRESCGMDAYDGEQVTPVYLRRMPPCNRRSSSEIVSLVSFANQCYKSLYWQTAREVREYVDSLVGQLPFVLETSPSLGWHSDLYGGYYTFERVNMELQRPETKGFVVSVSKEDDNLDGYRALLKCFLRRGVEPHNDVDHLTKSVRSGSVNIKRRWSPTY